jgi:hypothetical protein
MSKNIRGVLLRAESGLYFISDKDLETFKVPEEEEVPALKILDKAGTLKPPKSAGQLHTLEALHGSLGVRIGKVDWREAAINPTIPDKIRVENLARKKVGR